MFVNWYACTVCVCVCDSHLQEFCGRQVDVGVYYLKAGAQVLRAHLYNRKTNKQKEEKNHMVQLNKPNLNL